MVKLDATQRAAVSEAVRRAEARTSAEIVPVVAFDSGRYDRAEDAFGFVVGLLAVALVWWVYPFAPEPGSWSGPPEIVELVALLAAMIVGTGLGTALAVRVPTLRRLALPLATMQAEVHRAARALFHDQRIHHTQHRDAVMIYVSLFERTVFVLPDRAVEAKLGGDAVAKVCATLTSKLREGDVSLALVAGVEALGDALAEVLPADGEQQNELDDVLVVIE
jgi:putative membrane protein